MIRMPVTRSITHCPGCGASALTWPSVKSFTCCSCGFTLYLNIASAVAVIIEYRGKLLFGVRKHEPQQGMLDLPGGFVDPGETAEAAARRELKEELQLDLPLPLQYFCSFPNNYLYQGIAYDTLDLIFTVQLQELPQIAASDDLAAVLWLERDAIALEMIGFPSLRQAVQRYLDGDGER